MVCCDYTVLMVCLGLGPETTWLGFGKDHVLAQNTVPVLVATKKLRMFFVTVSGILNILGVC